MPLWHVLGNRNIQDGNQDGCREHKTVITILLINFGTYFLDRIVALATN